MECINRLSSFVGWAKRRDRRRPRRRKLTRSTRLQLLSLEERTLPSLSGVAHVNTYHPYPSVLVVADLNGDGAPDIITGSTGVPTFDPVTSVRVALNHGDGTFAPPITYSFPGGGFYGPILAGCAVADVNGDGIPDLLVSLGSYGSGPNGLDVLLGKGDGTFRDPVNYANIQPGFLVVGDFNGDGIPDIAVGKDGGVAVALGDGTGGFRPEVDTTIAGTVKYMAAGDLNGDGLVDLVATVSDNNDNRSVITLLGRGDGTFQAPGRVATAANPNSVIVADVNSDGIPDLVTTSPNGAVSVLLGNGDGTFQNHVDYVAGGDPYAVAVADVNGDGIPDLVVGTSGGASVLLGRGDGTFGLHTDYPMPDAYGDGDTSGSKLAVVDMNGDGNLDIVTTAQGGADILYGKGDGTFRTQTDVLAGHNARSVATGDLNGDGFADVVTANHDDDTVSVLLGVGNGTFRAHVDYAVGHQPVAVLIADVNGDGIPDLVTANQGSNTVSVLLGNGDGTFQSHVDYAVAASPDAVAAADFNGDGVPDLVTANGNSVSVLLGNGDGSFAARTDLIVPNGAVSMAAVDLNGDSIPDLLLTSYQGVSVLLGNGDGTFRNPTTFPTAGSTSLAVADLNGDGIPDVVTADPYGGVSVLLGVGDGSFRPYVAYHGGDYYPNFVTIADINGDGIPDILTATISYPPAPAGVNVFLGKGDGTFDHQVLYVTGKLVNAVAGVDLNGDGFADVVAANADNTLTVLLNVADWPRRPHAAGRESRKGRASAGRGAASLATAVRLARVAAPSLGSLPAIVAEPVVTLPARLVDDLFTATTRQAARRQVAPLSARHHAPAAADEADWLDRGADLLEMVSVW